VNRNSLNPLLSAIIPVSKMAGNFDCLRSWINKISNYSIQVILVHDIADENTGNELKEIIQQANKNYNIILTEDIYGSPGNARNSGLELAKGEWIAFWDSDDKPMLHSVFNALDHCSTEDEILVGGFITRNIVNGKYNKVNAVNNDLISVSINPGVWRMVFRNHIVRQVKFSHLRNGEDQLFLADLDFAERNIKYINDTFYEYTLGQAGQLTRTKGALKDLSRSTDSIFARAVVSSNIQLVFDMTLIVRQQMTLLKKGNIILKFQPIIFYFKNIKKMKLSILIAVCRALIIIIKRIKMLRIK